MTNHSCPKCKVRNTDYDPSFSFYVCADCGHSWGGILEGKNLNRAWYAFKRIKIRGTNSDAVMAHEIIFDNLSAIATALECNLGLKQLPNNSLWWIQHQDDIENKLLVIENQ